MKRTISFSAEAWTDYLYWVKNDQKTLKRINHLIEEITRNPFGGSGKPEPLKYALTGYWSRRINTKDRLVYQADENKVLVISCKGHYK